MLGLKSYFPEKKGMQGSSVFTALKRIVCGFQLNQQPFSQRPTGGTGLITASPLAHGLYHLTLGKIPNLCW